MVPTFKVLETYIKQKCPSPALWSSIKADDVTSGETVQDKGKTKGFKDDPYGKCQPHAHHIIDTH